MCITPHLLCHLIFFLFMVAQTDFFLWIFSRFFISISNMNAIYFFGFDWKFTALWSLVSQTTKHKGHLVWSTMGEWFWLGLHPWHLSLLALGFPVCPGQSLQGSLWHFPATELIGKGFIDSSGLGSISLQLEDDLDTLSLISISLLTSVLLGTVLTPVWVIYIFFFFKIYITVFRLE